MSFEQFKAAHGQGALTKQKTNTSNRDVAGQKRPSNAAASGASLLNTPPGEDLKALMPSGGKK